MAERKLCMKCHCFVQDFVPNKFVCKHDAEELFGNDKAPLNILNLHFNLGFIRYSWEPYAEHTMHFQCLHSSRLDACVLVYIYPGNLAFQTSTVSSLQLNIFILFLCSCLWTSRCCSPWWWCWRRRWCPCRCTRGRGCRSSWTSTSQRCRTSSCAWTTGRDPTGKRRSVGLCIQSVTLWMAV